jgi:hypothetical protein
MLNDSGQSGFLVIIDSKANLFYRRQREIEVALVYLLLKDFLTQIVDIVILFSMANSGFLQLRPLDCIDHIVIAPL